MDQKKTGALIAQARKEKGLTQEQLAKQLHVSHTTVSKWERGLGFPEVSLLEPLAGALELTLDELFKGTELPADAQPAPGEPERHKNIKAALICLLLVAFLAMIGYVNNQVPQKYGGDPTTIRGCWQHVPQRNDEEQYLVTLSADLVPDSGYQLYINDRLVDEGTCMEGEPGVFFMDGQMLDFTAQLTREKGYTQFVLQLPGLQNPLYMRKRGDFNFEHASPQYTDQAEYQKLLIKE